MRSYTFLMGLVLTAGVVHCSSESAGPGSEQVGDDDVVAGSSLPAQISSATDGTFLYKAVTVDPSVVTDTDDYTLVDTLRTKMSSVKVDGANVSLADLRTASTYATWKRAYTTDGVDETVWGVMVCEPMI